MKKIFNRKYFIFFTEWIGVNESLSPVFRYSALKATISLLVRDMSLEDVWKFYQKREMFYRKIRLLGMFFLLFVFYQLHKDFYSYFYQLSPILVTSYVCTLPILKTGHRYSDIWSDKNEFLNLVRSTDIENYKMQKANFWNHKNTHAEERILTIHYRFNFNVVIVQSPQRKRNPEYDRFWQKVEAGIFFHKLPPEEYLDISENFVFILKSKVDGQQYSFSYDTIFNKIKSDVVHALNAEKKEKAYLDSSLSFDARIKSLMCCKNNFNLLPMRNVILFFTPLHFQSDFNHMIKKLSWTDEQFISFIVSQFIDRDGTCLDYSLNGASKGTIATLFHQFYDYSTLITGEPKRSRLKKYYTLVTGTFCEFQKNKTDNFASTDIELSNAHRLYRELVGI